MQPLHAAENSPQSTATAPGTSSAQLGGLSADYAEDEFASRWEPQILLARPRATDPYAAWLAQREAERAAAPGLRRRSRRFKRGRAGKAPWEVILVRLSGDAP